MSVSSARKARLAIVAERYELGLRRGYPLGVVLLACLAAASTASALATLVTVH